MKMTLELIDKSLATAKEAAHRAQNRIARDHFEYALAHLRESWIAESGQNARSAEKIHIDVQNGLRFLEKFIRRAGE